MTLWYVVDLIASLVRRRWKKAAIMFVMGGVGAAMLVVGLGLAVGFNVWVSAATWKQEDEKPRQIGMPGEGGEMAFSVEYINAHPFLAEYDKTIVFKSVRETQVAGLLKPPATAEVFPGEVREHILAVLSEGLEGAQSSERERRAAVLEDVLAVNMPGSELERRRRELKQIIKDTGLFVDARTIAALEKLGFKCVSGNKHWKLDYANVRIPISKTPSDRRGAQNTATDIANRCF